MSARLHGLYVVVATASLVVGLAAPMTLGSTTYAAMSTTGSASATFRVDIPTERECAVWAGTDFEIRGARNRFDQCTHANHEVDVRGNAHRFKGGVRYVDSIESNDNGHVFERGRDKVSPASMPVVLALADYEPGGRAALAAGESYFTYGDRDDDDDGDVEFEAGDLRPGLHFVRGDVKIKDAHAAMAVTVVATGKIDVDSDDLRFTPFIDGLVFGAWKADGHAIDVQGDRGVFDGLLFAAASELHVGSEASGNAFTGRLVAAKKVIVAGEDNVVST